MTTQNIIVNAGYDAQPLDYIQAAAQDCLGSNHTVDEPYVAVGGQVRFDVHTDNPEALAKAVSASDRYTLR
jgi:hypothetical protein